MERYSNQPVFRSRLSFVPLLKAWEKISAIGKDEAARICEQLANEFKKNPALLEVIDDYETLKTHQHLIEQAIVTIFPAASHINTCFNAIATPFSNKVIYASVPFRRKFMEEKSSNLLPLDNQIAANIAKARVNLAYKLILKKFYNIDITGGLSFICAFPDEKEEIANYFELCWEPQFMDVFSSITMPPLPDDFIVKCHDVEDLVLFPQLPVLLPLDEFIFDGIILINIEEVTEREAVNQIRTLLEEDESLEKSHTLQSLKQQIHYLLQMGTMEVGICSFNVSWLKEDILSQPSSILLKQPRSIAEWQSASSFLLNQLKQHIYYTLALEEEQNPVTALLKHHAWKHALFAPLCNKENIIGCLEVYSAHPFKNKHKLISKLKKITPYLQLAVQKKESHFQEKIDTIVKDHFTAIAPSVEWKFNQAAIQYFLETQQKESPKMAPIIFEDVYPLYAAIDIRNSSTERNHAVQMDALQQLTWAKEILEQTAQHTSFPLLDELLQQVKEKVQLIKDFLWSTDEQSLYLLLQKEVAEMLQTLKEMVPDLNETIYRYFTSLDKTTGLFKDNQKRYEESVMAINHHLSDFMAREQMDAQAIYPHYFERFATDGIDFNMYIGQSIAPKKKFNPLFLQNLRLWQLKTVAMATRHLHHFQKTLALPLDTTQLILVYGQAINISFRTAERKFDVDGAYSARYEVVKKRIDKAYLKKTNERLTQPGTIAIVYTNERDIMEYFQHIEFLQKQELLENEIEKLEVDELQGVVGLKALRVGIKLEKETSRHKKEEKGTEEQANNAVEQMNKEE